MDFEVLVNKDNLLPKSFKPELYVVDENENNFHKYVDPLEKPRLSIYVKPYLDAMLAAAAFDGNYIIVDSGYRSYEYQEKILAANIEKKGMEAYNFVQVPGASEHQTGLAIDIAYFKDNKYSDDVKESDKEIKGMNNNAYKYGFILRYPKDKESITGIKHEPWHYRFVGVETAKIIHDNNLTLEEYKK